MHRNPIWLIQCNLDLWLTQYNVVYQVYEYFWGTQKRTTMHDWRTDTHILSCRVCEGVTDCSVPCHLLRWGENAPGRTWASGWKISRPTFQPTSNNQPPSTPTDSYRQPALKLHALYVGTQISRTFQAKILILSWWKYPVTWITKLELSIGWNGK